MPDEIPSATILQFPRPLLARGSMQAGGVIKTKAPALTVVPKPDTEEAVSNGDKAHGDGN